MIESGQLGRAMNMGRVSSNGLGKISDPRVVEQLREKFPLRSHPLSASVSKIKPVDSSRNLSETLLSLNPGVAPGCRGLRN